jgi:hypothetical protein
VYDWCIGNLWRWGGYSVLTLSLELSLLTASSCSFFFFFFCMGPDIFLLYPHYCFECIVWDLWCVDLRFFFQQRTRIKWRGHGSGSRDEKSKSGGG